jgi:glucosamine-6-phosphate deaminase
LKDIYFAKKRPGDEDIPQIKRLKGMMRESESDRVWSLERVKMLDIYHLRSKFYNNHSYENITNYDSDVEPIEQITNKINPDVITIPDDPVGIRPTTNYLALQSIARMLESYIKEKSFEQLPKIWGYRNIWFKYHVNEANIMVPVSQRKIDSELKIFDLGFNTQNTNSFPIPLYDAKFSEISTMLQQTQRKELGTLLGEDFFKNNKNKSIKNSVGFIFMKEMTVAEFISRANILKRNTSAEELST